MFMHSLLITGILRRTDDAGEKCLRLIPSTSVAVLAPVATKNP